MLGLAFQGLWNSNSHRSNKNRSAKKSIEPLGVDLVAGQDVELFLGAGLLALHGEDLNPEKEKLP